MSAANKKKHKPMHQPADIRDLDAAHSDGASEIELRQPTRSRADPRDVVEPIRRSFGPPKVVTREHTNNSVRWKAGERLNHLLEDACARFAANDAVITDGAVLTYGDLDSRANQVAR